MGPSWYEWISGYHDKSKEFCLTQIKQIAAKYGIDKFPCPVITVAGTNGKGSTVATLEALLLANGKKVGCYTSPHFFSFNERIRINGVSVAEERCEFAFNSVVKPNLSNNTPANDELIATKTNAKLTTIEKTAAIKNKLSFFESATLMALFLFSQENLDVILLEVGLGGAKDAVNVVDNNLSIITAIGLDHTEYLGNTREEIAQEKAGIIRSGSYFICGDNQPPGVLFKIAKGKAANVQFVDKDFKAVAKGYSWDFFNKELQLADLPYNSLPLNNTACALQALSCLQLLPKPSLVKSILKQIQVRGRFQREKINGVEVIFDVAHNPHAAAWLAEQLKKLPIKGQVNAIIGVAANKDLVGMLKPLLGLIDYWYPVDIVQAGFKPAKVTNSINSANYITEKLKGLGQKVICCGDMGEVTKHSMANAPEGSKLLVFGSFLTVANAFRTLGY